MYYYSKTTNKIQSTPFLGALIFPDNFMSIYYKEGKRASGFVQITDNGTTVTSCEWDEEAYQAWCSENPEPELVVLAMLLTGLLETLLGGLVLILKSVLAEEVGERDIGILVALREVREPEMEVLVA